MIGVILAGGKGFRFRSKDSKVTAEYRGKEIIRRVIEAMAPLVEETIVVVGRDSTPLGKILEDYPSVRTVVQPEPLGTGDALLTVADLLAGRDEYLLISFADKPLVTTSTFKKLMASFSANGDAVTLTTALLPDPGQKGRVVRENGLFKRIVEYKDAGEGERSIREINGGFLCARSSQLFERLRRLNRENAAGEYYLTDVFEEYIRDDLGVGTVEIDGREAIDINTSEQLQDLIEADKF